MPREIDAMDDIINRPLLKAAVKLNTILFAIVFGTAGGCSLFGMTLISLNRGLPDPGSYLNLLGLFLPGYNVSHTGAWIGLFWGAVIGGVLGALFYRIYARSIERQVREYLERPVGDKNILLSKMRIEGHSLGLALGSVVGVGLIITTNWLVFRGTAEESIHAALLAHFLPGYTVSMAGSIIGALQLFVVSYLLCRLFGWIYITIMTKRSGGSK